MISIVSTVVLILFIGILPSAFAQSDDVGSVLEKAQESLNQESEGNSDQTSLEGDYRVYENLNYNVKMQYPEDWSFEGTGYDEIFPDRVFYETFNSPFEVQSDIVLFSISIENLDPPSTTLNQYKDRITNNVKNNPDAKDMSVSDTTLDGKPAYRLEYISWIVDSERKSIDVTSVNDGRLQEVSAFGEPSAIDKYSEEIAKMIESVKFGQPLIQTSTSPSTQIKSGSDNSLESESASEPEQQQDDCDSSYPDFCISSPPPNLNCPDISQKRFTVQGSDPHGFDRDNDGVGCES